MSDEADAAQGEIELTLDRLISSARGEILPGVAGDCDSCGDWSSRLIEGDCAGCRDKAAKYRVLNGR